jgi:hypothetical protein
MLRRIKESVTTLNNVAAEVSGIEYKPIKPSKHSKSWISAKENDQNFYFAAS